MFRNATCIAENLITNAESRRSYEIKVKIVLEFMHQAMLLSRHQNAGQNHNTRIVNRKFENVATFIYSGTTVTNQNFIRERIKSKLKSANTCYHSIQKLSSSRLLFNVKIKTQNFNFAFTFVSV
jgi:hypothetical protein